MLSGRRQPLGSLELTYWRAYLVVRDEQGVDAIAHGLAGQMAGAFA